MSEIEENLQAAFKKLRVDAEGSTATLSVSESTSLRPPVRPTDETKQKNMNASKESWHCCLRKPLRGTVRTRRRRSKSPILHPPKFIHCSVQTSSYSQPASKSSTSSSESSPSPDMPAPKIEQAHHLLSDVDPGENGGEPPEARAVETLKNKTEGGAVSLPTAILKATDLADFQSLSEQHKGGICACTNKHCQCQEWQDMKVYKFSDLQNSLPSTPERTTRVQNNSQVLLSRTPSCSPRSCSEQARANVDDVTIEDLSGYMEYFLHIPKKMSHMAEMMYT
ncbi:oxidative stress-responsive serine-rich protein 1-like isoform X1 [Sphaerodactylus townsendi]|uniref:oxidative stress-responsive serine-rich protein 1-like isoform X1 n=1 Tax=Sphaerodactylus townsendi TaxID=933632 RepID=UPI002025BFCE|nr:oxidative stress-responsive serine-rich protein 1-like isoform X1 [Sphaerodactylus townsendi]XP_048354651.1 oxidative stress-responsive serine-rich protein 1-like isoform X1 [Sphaerodactylus townsendi]